MRILGFVATTGGKDSSRSGISRKYQNTVSLFTKRLKRPCALVEGIHAFNGSSIKKQYSDFEFSFTVVSVQ